MGVHQRFRVLSIVGLLTGAATALGVACGGDDAGDSVACAGRDCDGGAVLEAGSGDSAQRRDANTPPSDAATAADAHADSSALSNCRDGGPAGTLDETFGDGGMVWLKYPTSGANAVVVQNDGKIVVGGKTQGSSGYFAVARLLPNGSLDPTFGTSGLVEVKPANLNATVSALALQPDGKIVAAGFTRFTGQSFDFAILRLLPDGKLDPAFATGGVALTDFGGLIDAYGMSLAIQSDGRILVGGHADSADADYAMARYNSDGSLDLTFGASGVAKVDVRGTADGRGLIALAASGATVVAGASVDPNDGNRADISAARLGANGTLDPSFASGGRFVSSFGGVGTQAFALAVDASERIILGGVYKSGIPDDFAVVRLGSNGSLDPTWGDGGLLTTDFSGRSEVVASVRVQADGKLLAAGPSSVGAASDTTAIAIARYMANGILDPAFGSSGKILTPPIANTRLGVADAAIDMCSIVTVGTWGYDLNTGVPKSAMGVVRYRL